MLLQEANMQSTYYVGADEQEKATFRKWLLDLLKEREVIVTFTKKDGSERNMLCTLKEGSIIPYEKKSDKVRIRSEESLSVWDVENGGWRSFRFDTIKHVNFKLDT